MRNTHLRPQWIISPLFFTSLDYIKNVPLVLMECIKSYLFMSNFSVPEASFHNGTIFFKPVKLIAEALLIRMSIPPKLKRTSLILLFPLLYFLTVRLQYLRNLWHLSHLWHQEREEEPFLLTANGKYLSARVNWVDRVSISVWSMQGIRHTTITIRYCPLLFPNDNSRKYVSGT